MRYVLDCSVAVKWFVPESDSDLAERCLVREEAGEISFVAPDVLVPELGHTLRKHVVRGGLTAEEADLGLSELLSMRIEFSASAPLARDALRLAVGHSGTSYDALYLALAEREDTKVLTADERMTNAFATLERTVLLATFK